ncbi:hypothetical protein CAPTEDRAFT_201582 [Capitella teleta]|uniref:Transcription factor AP-2 C-terminal domain-containing protein n=1 Tax=Capitella teleta TaxID=283909 RepID=R7TBG3_CAPTE|nr:hypothetical protein CAPTEDRAFT_201582 [Capitella teleta]|eukprot:ELT88441.1 hypothetical protein CAPTEDRAFT_201582 [Capitella teleta]
MVNKGSDPVIDWTENVLGSLRRYLPVYGGIYQFVACAVPETAIMPKENPKSQRASARVKIAKRKVEVVKIKKEVVQRKKKPTAMVKEEETENEEVEIQVHSRLHPNLCGRTTTKLDITPAELRRRGGPPENFSAEAMRRYLRKGHNTSLGPALQYCSAQKMTDKSHFTFLAEDDATQLANDFLRILCSTVPPCKVDADACQKEAFRSAHYFTILIK